MYDRLLQRQIRRHMGTDWVLPDQMRPLFDAISATYQQYEQSRVLFERSIDISSRELMEANEKLRRESREQFRLLAENATDVVATWDKRGLCTYISPSCRFFLGVEPEELIGRSVLRFIHPDDFHLLRGGIRQVLGGAERVAVILRLKHHERGWLWFESSAKAVRNNRGRVVEFQTSSRDVEERVHAYESLRTTSSRLGALIDSLSGGVVLEDEDRRVVLANQPFCTMFRLSLVPNDLIGVDCRSISELSTPLFTDAGAFRNRVEEILVDRRKVVNERIEMADGRTFLRDYVPVSVDDQFFGHLWHYRDITERVTSHKRIEALNEELRAANERLRRGLDYEKEQVRILEELNTMKSDFVSSVSHELRTPLASIIGFAQSLLSDRAMPDEIQTEFLGIILQEGRRLAKLINDMLDLARIESGRIEVEKKTTDLASLVATAVETIAMQANGQSIDLRYPRPDHPIMAECDPDRIAQVVVNLLSNAVKFTPNGGSVRVCLREEDNDVFISVIDTGLGIPKEDIPNLFTRFYRVHRPGMDIRGTGLGLAIVKQLLDLHAGSIDVTSTPGMGSTFTVRLPKQ